MWDNSADRYSMSRCESALRGSDSSIVIMSSLVLHEHYKVVYAQYDNDVIYTNMKY